MPENLSPLPKSRAASNRDAVATLSVVLKTAYQESVCTWLVWQPGVPGLQQQGHYDRPLPLRQVAGLPSGSDIYVCQNPPGLKRSQRSVCSRKVSLEHETGSLVRPRLSGSVRLLDSSRGSAASNQPALVEASSVVLTLRKSSRDQKCRDSLYPKYHGKTGMRASVGTTTCNFTQLREVQVVLYLLGGKACYERSFTASTLRTMLNFTRINVPSELSGALRSGGPAGQTPKLNLADKLLVVADARELLHYFSGCSACWA